MTILSQQGSREKKKSEKKNTKTAVYVFDKAKSSGPIKPRVRTYYTYKKLERRFAIDYVSRVSWALYTVETVLLLYLRRIDE